MVVRTYLRFWFGLGLLGRAAAASGARLGRRRLPLLAGGLGRLALKLLVLVGRFVVFVLHFDLHLLHHLVRARLHHVDVVDEQDEARPVGQIDLLSLGQRLRLSVGVEHEARRIVPQLPPTASHQLDRHDRTHARGRGNERTMVKVTVLSA
jgi:hypothetical protein